MIICLCVFARDLITVQIARSIFMPKTTAIFAMTIALIVGCFIGQKLSKHSPVVASHVAPPAADVERYRIPIDGAPGRGADTPKVTIVEFSDFQCPFCSRFEPTLAELLARYGRDVRLVWKDFPLPQHNNAMAAALAGRAAAAQGKFWPLHDRMFKDQRALDKESLIKSGRELGIDLEKAFDDPKLQAAVQRDLDDARRFAVGGTPWLYVNGRPVKSALTVAAMAPLIDEELANAERALAGGADRRSLYATLTRDAKPAAQPTQPPAPQRVDIAIGNAPVRGKADAKVTVVEFSDFQCPACGRAEPTVQALQKQLGDGVKLVWKNLPLEMHPFAHLAAEAALAAGAQGKFWEMHDRLFANQQALDRQSLLRYAAELHLNIVQFEKALDTHAFAAAVDADLQLAQRLGINGTPTFFVDGQRIGNWTSELVSTAQNRLAQAQVAARPRPGRPDPATVYRALTGTAPARGATRPKVTLVEWADFECPYCARLNTVVETALKAHPDELRVVYKQYPLANHPHGHLTAEASLAAKAQGKFWEMLDLMFSHQGALDRAALLGYAQQLGLDVGRFTRELDDGTWKKAADAEAAEGQRIGVQATPSYYLDGKFHEGALPPEDFERLIATAIADADARLAKGTPRAKLYDTLMKTAKVELERPPLVEPESRAVDPGPSAPSRGRSHAPVTIVEFSDFQCPFCKRAATLLADVQKQHGDDVRVVFRNYPLPYHKNAQLLATAALAAKEQGRFWEMHDKLFANQETLAAITRATLDGYARELGLDVARFDAALDGGKLAAQINADVLAGGSLVDGTPTLFVNGHKLANPALLAQVVEAELKQRKN
jgi:protein-disulfide isomerase